MIKKCMFPVAGYGTRFLPATKSMPKEMLPVVNKPLVQYGVEEALDADLTEICLVTGRGKRAINDFFDISFELEHQIAGTDKEPYLASIRDVIARGKFATTRQSEMKGLGHAILTGELLVGNEPFGVVLADDLCVCEEQGVMAQLVEIYRRTKCSVIAIEEVDEAEVSKFGVIAGVEEEPGLYAVTDMVEKPEAKDAPSNLAIIGRYVLTPYIFEILRHTPPGKNGEVQLTDALLTMAKTSKVLAYKFKGRRFDCGSVDGYVEATNYVYKNIYLQDKFS
ncbi:MAG: UTP--glucose-1-phosphate uridylyltransferase [Gammaproteobacteria bacterium]|nr:MAG: UTP--glucose-1-phosphate uridylyltransferase [Gammaproteobacteria bacterium]RLA50545.1 MAG: UTP--glucose-1-phosphate uridylyltransferase [Gammaproteobacteria bacterium]